MVGQGAGGRRLTRRGVLLGAAAMTVDLLAGCGGIAGVADTDAPVGTAPGAPLPSAPPGGGAGTIGPPTNPLIIFAGASVVAGLGVPRADAFPAQTIALLAPTRYDAVTVAVSGRTVHTVAAIAPMEIDPRYAPSRASNIVVLYAGLNDLCGGASVEETLTRLATFGQARRRIGFMVVMGTLLPSTVDGGPGESYEARRQRVNVRLREETSRYADALADFAADLAIGAPGAATDRKYFQADGIHPTSAGHHALATVMAPVIARLTR